MLLAVLIFFRNYASFWTLCSLSPKLCYLDFTLILRKIKIISSLTLSILTLMNIHIVHLPVLQSLASQIRMCAPRKAKWLTNDTKINRFWVLNPGQKVIARILVLDAIQAKPSVHCIKTTMNVVNLFSVSKTQIFPWEFFDSITRTHVLWIWVTSFLVLSGITFRNTFSRD